MTQRVYLSLGSNLGDRIRNLQAAVEGLGRSVEVDAVSPIYQTDPVGVEDQPPFLNLALAGRTELSPEALLQAIKAIERQVGRQPTFRWGPRLIDIDILLYGDLVLDSEQLTIPHRDLHRRAFVLVPLADVASDAVHPILGTSVVELRNAIPSRGVRPYRSAKRSSPSGSPFM